MWERILLADLIDWGRGEDTERQSQTYLPIPWAAGGEHPIVGWQSVTCVTFLQRQDRKNVCRLVFLAAIFHQDFTRLSTPRKLVVASNHTVDHLWSGWVAPAWPRVVRQFGLMQPVSQQCDTNLMLHDVDQLDCATVDWSLHHALYIAL